MLKIILAAIPIGLAISVSPGAALFGIIQTSLSKGFKSGIFFALGISISDMLFIALCIWGFSSLIDNPLALTIFGLVSGALLISYGVITFLNQRDKVTDRQKQQVADRMQKMENTLSNVTPPLLQKERTSIFKPMFKGFLFNFVNPCAWILWIGILPITATYDIREQIVFFASILISIFSIDLLKSYFAGKIKNIIKPKVFYVIDRLIGIIFCILGIFMIVKMCILSA
ncbi:MAG: LysE family translocator [Bacteroidales bacterium]|nr:LysE family translocator [Bacteroidales bacterium]